jgi:hypothetical protein
LALSEEIKRSDLTIDLVDAGGELLNELQRIVNDYMDVGTGQAKSLCWADRER